MSLQLKTPLVRSGAACRSQRGAAALWRPRSTLRAQAEKGDQPDRSYEDLFKEEIARRGLSGGSVTSSREGSEPIAGTSARRNPFDDSDTATGRRAAAPPRAAAQPSAADAAASSGRDRDGQRDRSIAMVNEGLEGLIPRASQLLQLGGSVFLAFAPFIVAIALLFGGIYAVFGDSFVHGGEAGKGLPAYIDADALLAEPTVDPRVPYM